MSTSAREVLGFWHSERAVRASACVAHSLTMDDGVESLATPCTPLRPLGAQLRRPPSLRNPAEALAASSPAVYYHEGAASTTNETVNEAATAEEAVEPTPAPRSKLPAGARALPGGMGMLGGDAAMQMLAKRRAAEAEVEAEDTSGAGKGTAEEEGGGAAEPVESRAAKPPGE